MNKTVAIIGRGYVGKAYQKLFPKAHIYDRHVEDVRIERARVNQCDLSIICVPTNMNPDGSCDISIVEDVLEWLETPLVLIKSTIPPGTTERLKIKYCRRICHSPEYVGEGGYYIPFWLYPHPTEPQHHDFMIIGGDEPDCEEILEFFYPVLGPSKTYYQVTSTESELIKYYENCMIATKVTLANEFYELAKAFNVSYSKVREGMVLDSRLGRMFTTVFKDRRGFDGKCLPKDVNAIVHAAREAGYTPEFLQEVLKSNNRFRNQK